MPERHTPYETTNFPLSYLEMLCSTLVDGTQTNPQPRFRRWPKRPRSHKAGTHGAPYDR